MKSKAEIALRIVGVFSVLLGIVGISYNGVGMLAMILGEEGSTIEGRPYYPFFYFLISMVVVVLYVLLVIVGVQLFRLQVRWVKLLALVIVAEIVLLLIVGLAWRHPIYGQSIAAATGVSLGGLMFQVLILFPVWAPIVSFLAKAKITKADA